MTHDDVPRHTRGGQTDKAHLFTVETQPHLEQIRRGAYRLTANRFDAEDLVQETLLKAYKGFHTFEAGSNIRAWLFRIMHNAWVASYHARQRRPDEVLCDVFADWQLVTTTGPRSAEDEALATVCDARVTAALNTMPVTNRMTVYYADVEGYPYREIASLMDVPIGTVMSRLARGRKRLRTKLTDATQG